MNVNMFLLVFLFSSPILVFVSFDGRTAELHQGIRHISRILVALADKVFARGYVGTNSGC